MMIQGIIDRFEGDLALVEIEGLVLPVNRQAIPPQAREGDVIRQAGSGWIIDRDATEKLKREIQKLADELWK